MTAMTAMTTWDVFEDLRAAQDETFQMNRARTWRNSQRYAAATGSPEWAPAVDISERDDAYLVTVELSGVKPGDVEMTFEDSLLTIQGERHSLNADGEKVHRAERRYGPFRRSITLPSHVDANKIEASAQDGVLQVRVPKAKDVRAKRIEVRAGHTALTMGKAGKNGS
jgi:HSP20 family protein